MEIEQASKAETPSDSFCGITRFVYLIKHLCLWGTFDREQSLKYLDLSWNVLRGVGAAKICQGVARNETLQTLLLGWNGFGSSRGLVSNLSLSILKSQLQHVDLSYNRCNDSAAVVMAEALSGSSTLRRLNMSGNPGCMSIFFLLLYCYHNTLFLKLERWVEKRL